MYWLRFRAYSVFVKTLTIKKIVNSFKLRFSYYFSKLFCVYFHWGYPESLSVEPTNLCNLKCPECPSGNNKMTRPRLFLSFADFKKMMDECSEYLVNLQLFFQGEPFMHPKLMDYIRYATEKDVYSSISTNGHFLNQKNCESLLTAGLKRLIVSLDGTTQESYQKYRVGGSLNTVLQGIENIVLLREKRNLAYPRIILQFVVFSTNEGQIPEIKALAKKLKVDELQLKTAQIDDFKNGNALIPDKPSYTRYTKVDTNKYELVRKQNFKCQRIWTGSVVSAEGSLLPCCFDKNADFAYNKDDIGQIKTSWKAKKAMTFRQQVWDNYSQFEMCNNCTEGIKKHRGMLGV